MNVSSAKNIPYTFIQPTTTSNKAGSAKLINFTYTSPGSTSPEKLIQFPIFKKTTELN
jgi:hypothetical protein